MASLVEYGFKSISSGAEVNWSIGSPSRTMQQLFFYFNGWPESNEYRGFAYASYPTTFSYGLRSFKTDIGGLWHQSQLFWPPGVIYGDRVYFKAANRVPTGTTVHLTVLS
jgi:hypothetical protein